MDWSELLITSGVGFGFGLLGTWFGAHLSKREARRDREIAASTNLRSKLHELGYELRINPSAHTVTQIFERHLPGLHTAFEQWHPYLRAADRGRVGALWHKLAKMSKENEPTYLHILPGNTGDDVIWRDIRALLKEIPTALD